MVILSTPSRAQNADQAEFCTEWFCARVQRNDGEVVYSVENKREAMVQTYFIHFADTAITEETLAGEPLVLAGGETGQILTLAYDGPWEDRPRYVVQRILGDVTARHDDDYVYTLPFDPNASFKVIQGCDGRLSHQGSSRYAIDFAMPVGSTIRAARGGRVAFVKEDSDRGGPSRDFSNDGNYVIILHSDRTHAEYVHLQKDGALVEVGDEVEAGDPIGLSGNTGFSSRPHLHFVVRKAAIKPIDVSIPVTFDTHRGEVSCPNWRSRLRHPND